MIEINKSTSSESNKKNYEFILEEDLSPKQNVQYVNIDQIKNKIKNIHHAKINLRKANE